MRILFSAVSAVGHVFPLLPLENAAREAGHVTAIATGGELRERIPASVHLLPVGRTASEAMDEALRRVGDDGTPIGGFAVELFGGVAVDFAYDDLLDRAVRFSPDLIVADSFDYSARIVAAQLRVPWVSHAISDEQRQESDPIEARAATEFASRDVVPVARIALVDPYPDLLRRDGPPISADRLPIRPGLRRVAAAPAAEAGRPTVLLTMGTSVADHRVDTDTILDGILAAGADAIVTSPEARVPARFGRDRVDAVGFRPLVELLPRVDAVVFPGGTGTLLAALAAGVPMVIQPIHADQPRNAAAAARVGVAMSVEDESQIAEAIRIVLNTTDYRDAARSAADEIAAMPAPREVLAEIIDRAAAPAG